MTDPARWPPDQIVPKLAQRIMHLGPGPAAALRRGPTKGSGTAAYWRLVAQLEKDGLRGESEAWKTIIQSIAILTPPGQDPKKQSSHDRTVPMGVALFNAGLSELRLAHLLNARTAGRRQLVVRTCRRLASSGHFRFDLRTLAHFVLDQNSDRPADRIAREYYRAEARQSTPHPQEETST